VSAVGDPVPRLPHDRPFLLLDRVLEIGEKHGVFLKLVTAADPCIAPDGTLPAAFVLEALAQGGGAFLAGRDGGAATPGYLAGVDGFVLHDEVRVGDRLRVEVELLRRVAHADLFRGRGFVGERLVAEGRFTLALPR
jgi:UDP-3-O-[3-hydroxymyristoyl] N-acetylglucosamine deacetylase / 3-hydroxyacyl-[acyl-carrier-protein] dehydratase